MKPTPKAEDIVEVMDAMNRLLGGVGPNRNEAILTNTCTKCGKEANHFSDDISAREFKITGMCQSCQDELYSSLEEREDEFDPDDEFYMNEPPF